MDAVLSLPLTGILVTIACYAAGLGIKKIVPSPFTNPMVIAAALVIGLVVYTPLTVEQYLAGGNMITMFIGPVTVILSLRVYHERALLAQNIIPVLGGCVAGALASMGSVLLLCGLFGLDRVVTMSLLPKSVTTAIALDLSTRGGGVPGLAVAAVVVTGITTAVFAPVFIRIFRLKDPLAAGIAIGVSGHAIGTAAAVELGETEGAMSGLAMSLTGIVAGAAYMILF